MLTGPGYLAFLPVDSDEDRRRRTRDKDPTVTTCPASSYAELTPLLSPGKDSNTVTLQSESSLQHWVTLLLKVEWLK